MKKEFVNLSEEEKETSTDFAQLMGKVAQVDRKVRIRFSTSHPKDMGDELLHVMAKHKNICDYIHLPFQSGNSRVLELMNRGYTREWYMNRIDAIKRILPTCSISADIIAGFCSETEEEHEETLSMMEYVRYNFAYMFKYSERPNTMAQRKYQDDIPGKTKQRRLAEIIELQRGHSLKILKKDIGKTYEVLIEGVSKKSTNELYGRNTHNSVVVFPRENYNVGEYVMVKVVSCTSATLKGKAIK